MTAGTREVVEAFLDEITTSGMAAGARRYGSEGLVWWLPASLRAEPLRGRAEVVAWFEERGDTDRLFVAPPVIEVEHVVVEGDVAVAHFRSTASLRSGREYDNRYVFVLSVEDGRITELREFCDTQHVLDTFRA